MKITKSFILSVVALFVATFALSSCLNDDNDYKVPTKEEQASYQKLMAGTYGSVVRFYYQNYNKVVKYDSIKHYSWNVTADSTITMRDFPVCKLDSAIFIPKNDNSNRAQELAALRTAIHESQSTVKDFTSKYFVPNTSYQHQYGYKFAVYQSSRASSTTARRTTCTSSSTSQATSALMLQATLSTRYSSITWCSRASA